LYNFVRRIYSTGSVERLPGSGRRRSVRTDSSIELASDLILSQGWQSGTIQESKGDHERDWNFTFFSCEKLPRMICSSLAQCFDAMKFSPWQQQANC